MTLAIGDSAPPFDLPADGGRRVSLTDFIGEKVIVYFYPKNGTSGCTKEACSFRDLKPNFDKLNTHIIGISKDSIKSHDTFKANEKLNFTLASDLSGEVCEKYQVWVEKSMYGRKYFGVQRSTFLINEKGLISKIWRKVSVPGHVEEVLENVSRETF